MAEKQLVVKVREKGKREDNLYKNYIKLNDPNLLALVLGDLISMFNLPLWKAVRILKGEKEEKLFPFSPCFFF